MLLWMRCGVDRGRLVRGAHVRSLLRCCEGPAGTAVSPMHGGGGQCLGAVGAWERGGRGGGAYPAAMRVPSSRAVTASIGKASTMSGSAVSAVVTTAASLVNRPTISDCRQKSTTPTAEMMVTAYTRCRRRTASAYAWSPSPRAVATSDWLLMLIASTNCTRRGRVCGLRAPEECERP